MAYEVQLPPQSKRESGSRPWQSIQMRPLRTETVEEKDSWNPGSLRPTAPGIYKRRLASCYGANTCVFDLWDGQSWRSLAGEDRWCMQQLPWRAIQGHGVVLQIPAPQRQM